MPGQHGQPFHWLSHLYRFLWPWPNSRGGDAANLVKRKSSTPLKQVRIPCAARNFSPRVNFQCRLSYGVHTPPCAIACVNICAHVKDPVVYVRVRWIMETLKHPACTLGWAAQLSRSWLSQGKTTRVSNRGNPDGTIQLLDAKCKCNNHIHVGKMKLNICVSARAKFFFSRVQKTYELYL